MILTGKIQYAIALIDEIKNSPNFSNVTLKNVAEKYDISLFFLEQIARKLRLAGILKSQKGPGGGYVLSDGTRVLSLLDLYKALDSASLKTSINKERERVDQIFDLLKQGLDNIKL